jgi:diguanylate cyclase (GGDEF)-like protein
MASGRASTGAAVAPPARASLTFAAVGGVWAFAHGIGLLGPLEESTFVLVGAATFVAMVLGIARYRPALRWPWVAIGAALALFIIGGGMRQSLETVGDLSADRSNLPDFITLPGYLLVGAGLAAIARARGGEAGDRDMVLDGVVASLAAFTIAWVYLISPTLFHEEAPFSVRLLLACYPPLSVFLVAVAARMAFTSGGTRSPAHLFLLTAMICMLAGDLVYMLVETHVVNPPESVIDLPYVLAYVALGACVLHPSVRDIGEPVVTERRVAANRSRLAFIAVALAIPAFVTAVRSDTSTSDRVVLSAVILALTAAAIWRVSRALSANARSEARLAHQATHDVLTGLPNRVFAGEHVTRALRRASTGDERVALLFLDVDRFKLVNDTLGHSRGDELLVAVARRLQSTVRPGDLVARIGGDEFIIVIDHATDTSSVLEVGERIRNSFRQPFLVRGLETFSSASVGIALADASDPQTDAESLIRDADTAMYEAKASGRDAIRVFDASMRERTAERLTIERFLRHALERGELTLLYQPIVELSTSRVTSVEALIRWRHPTLGEVSPSRFIPVAEDTGLIVEIGAWALGEACSRVAEWRRLTPALADLRVAVNLSARQLRDDRLIATVRGALDSRQLPADALILELTESLLMDDPPAAAEILTNLRGMGVRLAIDDFGTGYSSLAYLKRFPVDAVKIDRAFVEALDREDTSEETLVAAIIAMTKALSLTTVAEGVETAAQADRLKHLGCTFAQGYLYSYPLAPALATEVLQRGLVHAGPVAGARSSRPDRATYRSNEAASGPEIAASSSESEKSSSYVGPSSSARR